MLHVNCSIQRILTLDLLAFFNSQLCLCRTFSNPRNKIGIFVMGTTKKVPRLDPTSDLKALMAPLRCPQYSGGGELDILSGITSCRDKLDHYPNNPKRIVFFTGGPRYFKLEVAESYGGRLKHYGIAVVDVVNFFLDEQFALSKLAFETFVASANNNNNNSLIRHIPPDSLTPVRDVLSRERARVFYHMDVVNVNEDDLLNPKPIKLEKRPPLFCV
ncbi:26S proteasome non-ATPase regulatory subunit 4 homolog [Rutidosis leptorrhynchoides]|uniref:26S proteasome non-ATPase regulatory subunit 4 homolog n=1 Tax=Rutidosis leptorrhynchoides TaxID=125765 RepID=UPI003A994D0D